jgi:hypothetical protein
MMLAWRKVELTGPGRLLPQQLVDDDPLQQVQAPGNAIWTRSGRPERVAT